MSSICSFCSLNCENCKDLANLSINYKNKRIYADIYLKIFRIDLIEFALDDPYAKICLACFKLLEKTYYLVQNAKDLWDQNAIKMQAKNYRPILPKLKISTGTDQFQMIEKKNIRIYKCADCPLNFNSHRQLKKHQETHTMVTDYICDYCCCLFANKHYLEQHKQNCHKYGKFTCLPCKKEYKNRGQLLNHVNNIHKTREMLYYCSICPESTKSLSFTSRNAICKHFEDFHKSTSHQTNSLDIDDDEIEMNVEFLDEYLLNNTDENSFQFSECWDCLDLHFPDVLHLQNLSSIQNKNTFICPKCTEGCANIKSLFSHLSQKHAIQCSSCGTCNVHSQNKNNLQSTYTLHNCDNAEHVKRFNCPYCHKIFRFGSYLRQHLRNIHSQLKRHICQLCDLQFSTLDHLKKHVLSRHQNDRKHICHICAKRFTQICHLKQHLAIHKYDKT